MSVLVHKSPVKQNAARLILHPGLSPCDGRIVPFLLLLLYRFCIEKQGTHMYGMGTILLFGKTQSPRALPGDFAYRGEV